MRFRIMVEELCMAQANNADVGQGIEINRTKKEQEPTLYEDEGD